MSWSTSTPSYTRTAVWLHWILAALIVTQLFVGFLFHRWTGGDDRAFWFEWHKTLGVLILLLSLVRLTWRLLHRPPAFPATMPLWQQAVARFNHWAFYFVMIALPLTGYAAVSTGRRAIETGYIAILGGALKLPLLPLPGDAHEWFEETHILLVWATLTLLGLHLGAVLKHLVIDRGEVPGRMLTFLRARR